MSSLEENVARVAEYYSVSVTESNYDYYKTGPGGLRYGRLKDLYQTAFAGQDVLELACGPGYWTEVVAHTAKTVLSTDVNQNLVAAAQGRLGHLSNVRHQVASAYSLDAVQGTFSAAFAQFWWSHIPKRKLSSFLDGLHSKLRPGARVMFSDDLMYDWTGNRRTDEHGDIYEERITSDGARFETIKNFPSDSELTELLSNVADDVSYVEYEAQRVWVLSYRLRQ